MKRRMREKKKFIEKKKKGKNVDVISNGPDVPRDSNCAPRVCLYKRVLRTTQPDPFMALDMYRYPSAGLKPLHRVEKKLKTKLKETR